MQVDHPELFTAKNLSFETPNGIALALQEGIFRYAKENMALVNVYIKDPVVTRIKRDQKIPIIGFVANTGGLLGLCMGFSLISAFEIIFHFLISIKKMYLFLYGHCTKSIDRVREYTDLSSTNNSHRPTRNSGDNLSPAKVELKSGESLTFLEDQTIAVLRKEDVCSQDLHNDKQDLQISLQNSIFKSGLVTDISSGSHEIRSTDGYVSRSCVISESHQKRHVIENASNIDNHVNHINSEMPITNNLKPILSLKPTKNKKCNTSKQRSSSFKNSTTQTVSRRVGSNSANCSDLLSNSSLNHTTTTIKSTSTIRGCKSDSPKKVNIILPPRAHSETSSVNSSRDSLERIQSITLQNASLSFHFDLENFSHIDETDNEEEVC